MVKLIILATSNKNKIREFKEILKDYDIEIKPVSDFGPIPQPVEDGKTFDDNAYKKAFHTARILGIPSIADDSGLCVEALDGKPGVLSARYAGHDASDEDNCKKLLFEIKDHENRNAKFVCNLSIAVPSGPALTYEAECHGKIIDELRGDNGFGYDPLFFVEEFGKTFAELNSEEKNSISHRGKALREFKEELPKVLKWLDQRLFEERPPKPDHNQYLDNDWSS